MHLLKKCSDTLAHQQKQQYAAICHGLSSITKWISPWITKHAKQQAICSQVRWVNDGYGHSHNPCKTLPITKLECCQMHPRKWCNSMQTPCGGCLLKSWYIIRRQNKIQQKLSGYLQACSKVSVVPKDLFSRSSTKVKESCLPVYASQET